MLGRNLQRMKVRWPVVAMLIAAAAMPVPAAAQFFFGPPRPSRPPPPQQRGFFGFPFLGGPGSGSGPFYAPAPQQRQPVESFNPPPQKKYETPPTSTVAVVGDTMADWLAYGLEEALSDTPDVGVARYIRPTSGLVRYDPKNDQLEWSAAVKDILGADKPSAIVVMLGLSDRLPLRDKIPPKPPATPQGQDKAQDKATETPASSDAAKPGAAPPVAADDHQGPPGTYDFHTDKWAELYSKRIDDMIAALKSKGVPVLWVGLPALYGTKSTSDMSYLDELFRERAERAGITYVDIWDGFVDESGRYVTQGPDFEGQTRRLRTGDGVHFTKAGAIKLAEYVVQDLHRVMNNRLAPIALPATTEDAPKPGTAGPRPAVGPVLPLSASVSANTDGNNLLGDGGRTQPADPDPVATRVLVHGDPIAAPSGRADDFSWPRRTTDTGGSANAEPDPAAAAPAAKGSAAKPDVKKTTDAKNNAKPAPNVAPAPAAPHPAPPRASLDGAPRPPAPVDGGF
jgi:hypothetical protein